MLGKSQDTELIAVVAHVDLLCFLVMPNYVLDRLSLSNYRNLGG